MNTIKINSSYWISFVLLFFVVTCLNIFAQVMNDFPFYKDINKPVEERVSDLLSKMTLEEKVDLVSGAGFNTKKNIRLGIPELLMADGPQGPNSYGRSTHYGAMINLAATFNTDLMYEAANNMGKETRIFGRNMLLAPMINIIRTPFGGRSYECYSEDPFLTARMGVSAVKGIQDAGVVSSTKVLTANNQEWNRMVADVRVSERALREIYLPAAKAAVQEADTWSIMTAYNKINGIYAGENKHLIQDILKDEWGFSGFAVSDWGGTHSTVESANAGLDLEMPIGNFFDKKLVDAVKNGKVKESILDDKVSRILRVMFKAGLFDESPASYGGHSNTPERRALALKAARQSIVLLENARLPGQKKNFLPLNRDEINSIAVIGPNGDVARMTGAGSGSLKGNYDISPLHGISDKVGDKISVEFSVGIPKKVDDAAILGSEYFTTPDGKPGIYAEYYNNKEQEGEPVYTTIEKDISFNWEHGSPREGVVNLDKWSAKFTGKLKSPGEGWYEIGFRVDNGVRLYINGEKVLDAWLGTIAGKFNSVRYKFEKDRNYDIQVDFFENIGTCQCQFGLVQFNTEEKIQEAVDAALKSEVIILAVGLNQTYEGESVDRVSLALDDDQLKLIHRVLEVNKNTVVVLNNGTPITMDGWLEKTPAVIDAFYPGQEGGNALADILFGDVSPSGKLPMTFPKSEKETPVADTYPGTKEIANYDEGIFVGYRWYDKNNIEPLFPFGYGLSYTTFEFSDIKLSKISMTESDSLFVEVTITNSGKVAGDEVVQMYISDKEASVEREIKSLKGFKRVSLKPGESKKVSIKIDKSALAFYNVDSKLWLAEPGEFEVLIGSSSRDIRLKEYFELK